MADLKRCDRCGRIYEPRDYTAKDAFAVILAAIESKTTARTEAALFAINEASDLCEPCESDFRAWWNEPGRNCADCSYKLHSERISELPDCNDCSRKDCEYRPEPGEWVRVNCPLHTETEGADLVEVVRCRECRHNTGEPKCLHPDSIIKVPKDDDFCSYGEKREADGP